MPYLSITITSLSFISKSISTAIIRGLKSLPGAVLGGMIIGLCENMGGAYIPTPFNGVTAFLAIMMALSLKPYGLFAK